VTKKTAFAKTAYEKLSALYPSAHCTLDYHNAFELLCATCLAAQCTDLRVNIVTPFLFAKYPTPHEMAGAAIKDIENIIRSTGFYHNKAKNLVECARKLCDAYGGEVPSSVQELTALAGVGRKTANVVLGEIWHKPAVVVDTHTGRLSRRMGLTKNVDPTKVEHDLEKILPPEISFEFCHLLVYHGREICTARKPKCAECALAGECPRVGVK
jgi:endonuclease-3